MEENQMKKEEFLKLNFFQKVWYSITKFERYPEMAALGVKKALLYFTELMLVLSILVTFIWIYYVANVAEFEESDLTFSQKVLKVLISDSAAVNGDERITRNGRFFRKNGRTCNTY